MLDLRYLCLYFTKQQLCLTIAVIRVFSVGLNKPKKIVFFYQCKASFHCLIYCYVSVFYRLSNFIYTHFFTYIPLNRKLGWLTLKTAFDSNDFDENILADTMSRRIQLKDALVFFRWFDLKSIFSLNILLAWSERVLNILRYKIKDFEYDLLSKHDVIWQWEST